MNFALEFFTLPEKIAFYQRKAHYHLKRTLKNFNDRTASFRDSVIELQQAETYLKLAAKGESWWWSAFKGLLNLGAKGFAWLFRKLPSSLMTAMLGTLFGAAGAHTAISAVGGLILPAGLLSATLAPAIGLLGAGGLVLLTQLLLNKLTGKEKEELQAKIQAQKLDLKNSKDSVQVVALAQELNPTVVEQAAEEVVEKNKEKILEQAAKATAELAPKESAKILQEISKDPTVKESLQEVKPAA